VQLTGALSTLLGSSATTLTLGLLSLGAKKVEADRHGQKLSLAALLYEPYGSSGKV